MLETWTIEVPGAFDSGVAMIDLETDKTPTPDGYRMPNGETLRRRWKIVMAGVARNGFVNILAGVEDILLVEIGLELEGLGEVLYGATREFDEMICRGRFTNARRAHLPVPTFPAVPGAEDFAWRNLKETKAEARGADIPSRDVPAALRANDGRWEAVAVHLLRDVCELILAGGNPDDECAAWCRRVLVDYDFALAEYPLRKDL